MPFWLLRDILQRPHPELHPGLSAFSLSLSLQKIFVWQNFKKTRSPPKVKQQSRASRWVCTKSVKEQRSTIYLRIQEHFSLLELENHSCHHASQWTWLGRTGQNWSSGVQQQTSGEPHFPRSNSDNSEALQIMGTVPCKLVMWPTRELESLLWVHS